MLCVGPRVRRLEYYACVVRSPADDNLVACRLAIAGKVKFGQFTPRLEACEPMGFANEVASDEIRNGAVQHLGYLEGLRLVEKNARGCDLEERTIIEYSNPIGKIGCLADVVRYQYRS